MRKRGLGNTGVGLVRKNGQEKTPRWIGVDLDGTLAKSVVAQIGDEIGPPIDPMVQLVKEWLAHGEDVRIFTARVNPYRGIDAIRARRQIEAWCQHHLGLFRWCCGFSTNLDAIEKCCLGRL